MIDENGVLIHDGKTIPQLEMPKDPDSVKDYRIALGNELDEGETITVREWTVISGGFTVDSNANAASEVIGNKTYTNVEIVWLSGGTVGTVGTIRFRYTTSQGRSDDWSFKLLCQDK